VKVEEGVRVRLAFLPSDDVTRIFLHPVDDGDGGLGLVVGEI
jgi:hypothetical protein